MSKKKQQQIVIVKKESPVESSVSSSTDSPLFELIRFDIKTNIFLLACLALFCIFVSLKWHNSSIPRWNEIIEDGGSHKRGLIKGKPLTIRSDEWLVNSSFVLSQIKLGFPVSNEALGYGKTPIVMGLPTKSIVSKLRVSHWGYYFLDSERAFSWLWNFKIAPFLIASFLLLMLFTRNNFLLSVFGSIWLFLSSAIQWWSIGTELFTYGFLSVISFIYLLYSDKPKIIMANGILFFFASYSFAMNIYPAYQVPLAYFLVTLIIGYILKNKNVFISTSVKKLPWKIVTFVFSFSALLYIFFLFYQEAKETIDVVSNTVYPGKRNEGGGDFSFLKMFSDNFSIFMSEGKFPAKWGNICELSSYLMLAPIASIFVIWDFIKTKKTDILLFVVLAFQLVLLIWILFGFPEFLAKLTLFKTSPSYRTFFIFGFSNVIFTILFLSHGRISVIKNNIATKIILFIGIFILAYFVNNLLNKQADSFFSDNQVLKATFIFSCLNWLVLYFKENKVYQGAFYGICFLFIIPNIKINPLSVGLAPYYQNEVFKTVSDINTKDPKAGWVVFGKMTHSNFLKAAGINCFSGVKFTPPLEKMKVLDVDLKNDSIYNRYAHIVFSTFINGVDSVRFKLLQSDFYMVQMDPCSPRLNKLGIKYFLFTYKPQDAEVRDMVLVSSVTDNFIYKRK